jgi:hypothetical protein
MLVDENLIATFIVLVTIVGTVIMVSDIFKPKKPKQSTNPTPPNNDDGIVVPRTSVVVKKGRLIIDTIEGYSNPWKGPWVVGIEGLRQPLRNGYSDHIDSVLSMRMDAVGEIKLSNFVPGNDGVITAQCFIGGDNADAFFQALPGKEKKSIPAYSNNGSF